MRALPPARQATSRRGAAAREVTMHSAPAPGGLLASPIRDDAALRPAIGILFDAFGRLERDGHRCAARSFRSRLQRAVRLSSIEELDEEVRRLEADLRLLTADDVGRTGHPSWP